MPITKASGNSVTAGAKGDLVVGNATNDSGILSVGANGETLVADSSTSTGLRWQGDWNTGKNKIINGAFDFWQRGTSFTIAANAAYGADRFICDSGALNYTFSRQTFTPGSAPVAGYEGQYFIRAAANSGSGGFPKVYQKIEDVRTLAGQTVTLSVWAKASTNTNIGLQIAQNFGTGGSPSSSWFSSNSSVAITTSWQRYSFTVALPSLSGSTIGTNNDSSLWVFINIPSTGTASIDLWGVQLEAGSVATPFTRAAGTLAGELAACQRYFWQYSSASDSGSGFVPFGAGHGIDANNARIIVQTPVTMRVSPSLSFSAANTFVKSFGNSLTSIVAAEIGRNSFSVQCIRTGEFAANQGVLITANGTQAAFISASAEL